MFGTQEFIFRKMVVCTGADLCTEHTLSPTRLLTPLAFKQIIQFLYVQPNSWRWSPGFDTCTKHHNN